MRIRSAFGSLGAAGTTGLIFGLVAALGGATHGIGEVLQGNVAVDGIAIDSWTSGPIARNLGGEPGITVLPTALAAGIATLAAAAAVAAWSLAGLRRKHGGLILALLSVGMLLAGGGVGPPVIGMLAGAVGRWSPEHHPRWVERRFPAARRFLARAWAPLFTLAVLNGTFLVLGSLILVYTIDFNHSGLFEGSFYLTVVMLLLMLATAPVYDAAAHPAAARRAGLTGSATRPDVPAVAITPRG
jgi:hypothetical protein